MQENAWRDFDLTARKEKIRRAFAGEPIRTPDDVPLIVSTGNYFGFGGFPRSPMYWEDPACMLDFQTEYHARHMARVHDDMIPYFMPWFGTGVLASGFGCKIKPATGQGDAPAVMDHAVNTPAQAARLKPPDPHRDGLMPKVLRFIEYARTNGDLPVGPTDLNSPLSTLAQVCGYENLFIWMYDEPSLVHELMDMVTEAFINWVKLQKEYIGEPLNQSNGLQGVWSPEGVGIWISDDDNVSVGAELYGEFVVPYYNKLFKEFEGGSLHYCGVGTQHLDNFKKIGGIRAINNSPMGNATAFKTLVENKPKGVLIQVQDAAPNNPEEYYEHIFSSIQDFSGIMVATFLLDTLALTSSGETIAVTRDPFEAANRTVDALRSIIAKKLNAAKE